MEARKPDVVIDIKDVARTYHVGDVDLCALHGVSLTIERGEFVAIVGSSGSGKSTLMAILGCLDRPTSGQYWFEGVDVARLSEPELAAFGASASASCFRVSTCSPAPAPQRTSRFRCSIPRWLRSPRSSSRSGARRTESSRTRRTRSRIRRRSCPAGSSSAWRLRARSSTLRACSWRTSRPATSIPARLTRSWTRSSR